MIIWGRWVYVILWGLDGQLTTSSPSSSRSSRELGYLILLAGSWYADRRTPQLSKHYSPTTALLYKLVEHYSFTLHPTQLTHPLLLYYTSKRDPLLLYYTPNPTTHPLLLYYTSMCKPQLLNYTSK